MVHVSMNGRKKAPRMVASRAVDGVRGALPRFRWVLSTLNNPVTPFARRPLVPVLPTPCEFVVGGEYEEGTGKTADNLDGEAD